MAIGIATTAPATSSSAQTEARTPSTSSEALASLSVSATPGPTTGSSSSSTTSTQEPSSQPQLSPRLCQQQTPAISARSGHALTSSFPSPTFAVSTWNLTTATSTTPASSLSSPVITPSHLSAADRSLPGSVTLHVVGFGSFVMVTTDGLYPLCGSGSTLTTELFLTCSGIVKAISCGPALSSEVLSVVLVVTPTPSVKMQFVFGTLGSFTQTQISSLEATVAAQLGLDP
eukprot:443802-Rhodomonas_salina.3